MTFTIIRCPACRTRYSRQTGLTLLALILAACAVSFGAGYRTSGRLHQARVFEEGRRQFMEFLTVGIDLGFVSVDRQKMDEINCIVSESEWEDRDAGDRAAGGTP